MTHRTRNGTMRRLGRLFVAVAGRAVAIAGTATAVAVAITRIARLDAVGTAEDRQESDFHFSHLLSEIKNFKELR